MANDLYTLTWPDIQTAAGRLAVTIAGDGLPEVIVGNARGGLTPAVMLSHLLGVRDLRTVIITHNESDAVNAAKTPVPAVAGAEGLGDLCGRDVLFVDDIAGTGDTLTHACALLHAQGATRVRTVVLAVNSANWRDRNQAPTYADHRDHGWVVFPWEAP